MMTVITYVGVWSWATKIVQPREIELAQKGQSPFVEIYIP